MYSASLTHRHAQDHNYKNVLDIIIVSVLLLSSVNQCLPKIPHTPFCSITNGSGVSEICQFLADEPVAFHDARLNAVWQ